tara:strand:- start:534 stop:713 length:180 start_codon:yes stop_codon:yes gene_type:complete
MQSSNSSRWESVTSHKPSIERGIASEALITSTTRELIEFYWNNQKRFSGAYKKFPVKVG